MSKFRHVESINQPQLQENTQTRSLPLNQTGLQSISHTLFTTGMVLALDPDFTTTIPLPEIIDQHPESHPAMATIANTFKSDLSDANHLLSSQQDHIDFSSKLGKVLSPVSLQLKDSLPPPPIEALLDEPDHMISDLLNRIAPITDTMFIASSGQPVSPIMPIDLSTFAPFDSHDLHSLELLNNLIIDEDILS